MRHARTWVCSLLTDYNVSIQVKLLPWLLVCLLTELVRKAWATFIGFFLKQTHLGTTLPVDLFLSDVNPDFDIGWLFSLIVVMK